MKIAIASDHAGYQLKQLIAQHLSAQGLDVQDMGPGQGEKCDYPQKAILLGECVAGGHCTKGILVCGTGIGMSITANKVRGVRAALCADTFSARMAASHNNANVICLGERTTGPSLALDIVDSYLNSGFEGGRHADRVDMVNDYDRGRA